MNWYAILHFLHLTIAAVWIGAAIANDLLHRRLRSVSDPGARVALAQCGTAVTRKLELHGAILMPILGFLMLAVGPGFAIFQTGAWFHLKLTAALVLIAVSLLSVSKQLEVARAAEAGGVELQRRLAAYFKLRLVGLLAILAILYSVIPGLMRHALTVS